jgi:DNA-directed RNA polymerase specialized sigma24 family protein
MSNTQAPAGDAVPSASPFPTTRWSRVLAARDPAAPDSRAALAELCGEYWYPIYALIRRRGHPADEARDLAQDYFARLLEKGTLVAANPDRGRFRAFLKTDCGFFLGDCRDREHALKRGGERATVSFDSLDAEARYHAEPADATTPERMFDRAWALTLLDGVLDTLAVEYAASGRGAWFERLRNVLTEGPGALPYAEFARQLGTTEAAVQQAVRRLRKRYRDALRARIAATLDAPDDAAIEDEVRDLFAALAD